MHEQTNCFQLCRFCVVDIMNQTETLELYNVCTQKHMSHSLLTHIWLCVWECMNLRVCPGKCPPQLCGAVIWGWLLLAVKILLQVFIITALRDSGSVVCRAGQRKRGVDQECVRGRRGFYAHSFCSHRPAPSEARCIVGSGEAYWSWLVPAESQIEFWQAGETGSQRERPPSSSTPLPSPADNRSSMTRAF